MTQEASWLRAHLDQAVRELGKHGRLPTWQELKRLVAASGILCVGVAGCGGDGEDDVPSEECSGDSCATLCQDDQDNDEDGQVDCDDEDCISICAVPAYGVPMQTEDCTNQTDDDADGAADCDDQDCAALAACTGGVEYGIYLDEQCGNGQDDDQDGATDCDDADCVTYAACSGGNKYAVSLETDCSNDRDDDGDGAEDCDDADCAIDPACGAISLYAAPVGF